jgi:hypothetical protein
MGDGGRHVSGGSRSGDGLVGFLLVHEPGKGRSTVQWCRTAMTGATALFGERVHGSEGGGVKSHTGQRQGTTTNESCMGGLSGADDDGIRDSARRQLE